MILIYDHIFAGRQKILEYYTFACHLNISIRIRPLVIKYRVITVIQLILRNVNNDVKQHKMFNIVKNYETDDIYIIRIHLKINFTFVKCLEDCLLTIFLIRF